MLEFFMMKLLFNISKENRIKTIFIIVFICALIWLPYDLFFSDTYKIFGTIETNDGIVRNDPINYFLYWTQLSNIAVLIWITLLLFSIIGKKDKMEFKLNGWFLRGTLLTVIITTGTVFMLVAFIPVVVTYSTPGSITINGNIIDDYDLFHRIMTIFTTTLKHFVVPMLFMWEVLAGKINSKNNDQNESNINKVLKTTFIPLFYFVFVVLVLAIDKNSYPPYAVFWFASSWTSDKSVWILSKEWIMFLSLLGMMAVLTWYCILYWAILKISDKKCAY